MANQLTSGGLTVGSGSITTIIGTGGGILAKGRPYIAVQTTGSARNLTTLPLLSIGEIRAYRTLTDSENYYYYRQGFVLPSGGYRVQLLDYSRTFLTSDPPLEVQIGAYMGDGRTGTLFSNYRGDSSSYTTYIVIYQRLT